MSLIKNISIGTAAIVAACVLTLSSSIGGYPNNILPYALAEENNNNQSSSISILNKKGLGLLSSASYNEATRLNIVNPTTARGEILFESADLDKKKNQPTYSFFSKSSTHPKGHEELLNDIEKSNN